MLGAGIGFVGGKVWELWWCQTNRRSFGCGVYDAFAQDDNFWGAFAQDDGLGVG